MKKTALFYSFNTGKSAKAGEKIAKHFEDKIDVINAENVTEDDFLKHDNLIISCPTWFDGELPNYWDEFVPALEELDLKGKKAAIYGAGDQIGYPENFVDAVGIMAGILKQLGVEIVGYTSASEYSFESSKALDGDKFCGLALDFENQAKLNEKRITDWCKQLKKEFN
ncbi:MAG: flavodoxin [Bacteroidales bacterium]|nr:flavodoxin [Bacteroidales bacterium]